jgi:FkbM family methyltransferase
MRAKSFSLNNLRAAILLKLRSRGLSLTKTSRTPTLEGLLLEMLEREVKIENVFDIGAYRGEWTDFVSKILQDAKFEMFEPNKVHNEYLQKIGHRFHNFLLANENRDVKFHSIGSTGDSIYLEHNPIYDGITPELLHARTLDDLMSDPELALRQPDLIKIDTQGSEIDILRGGLQVSKNAKIIILECPIVEYNLGAPKFDEYISFMHSIGFIPVRVTEVHILLNTLIQIDLAFVNRKFFGDIYGISPNW